MPPLHGSIKGRFYFEDMSFADARPCISLLPKHHFEHEGVDSSRQLSLSRLSILQPDPIIGTERRPSLPNRSVGQGRGEWRANQLAKGV